MLTTKHLEDYILKKENDTKTVELGVDRGQRRLNEDLLAKPYVSLDLNEGRDEWIEDEKSCTKTLDPLLKWMIKKSPEGNSEEVLNGAKFVSRRGVLARMAQGEYLGSKEDWQVLCVRRGGVIYLQEEKSSKDVRRTEAGDLERASWYWGHRFEVLMLQEPPDVVKSPEYNPLDQLKTDIRVVMEATLTGRYGAVELLYSGEIDAIDSDGHLVEVKTVKERERGPGYWFWKEKSLQWWMHSRLVDVDYLVLGHRDDE